MLAVATVRVAILNIRLKNNIRYEEIFIAAFGRCNDGNDHYGAE